MFCSPAGAKYQFFKLQLMDYFFVEHLLQWLLLYSVKTLLILAMGILMFILENCMWLQLILFLKCNFLLGCGMFFSDWWDTNINHFIVLQKLLFSLRLMSAIMDNSQHCIISFDCFTIDKWNQVKISRKIIRCQGYFLKIALGTR